MPPARLSARAISDLTGSRRSETHPPLPVPLQLLLLLRSAPCLYPSTAGARSARSCAPRAWTRDPTRHSAHRALARVDARRAVARSGPAVRARGGETQAAPTFSPSPPPRAARRGSQASGASVRRLREMNGGEERAGVRREQSWTWAARPQSPAAYADSPEHGAVHSAGRPCESRAMTCKSKRATTGEDRMSGRSSSWRLQPSASAPSLPRSKRAGVRPSESHFNPTLSHFIPLSVPLCGPNPTESRRIPAIPGSKCSLPRVPG